MKKSLQNSLELWDIKWSIYNWYILDFLPFSQEGVIKQQFRNSFFSKFKNVKLSIMLQYRPYEESNYQLWVLAERNPNRCIPNFKCLCKRATYMFQIWPATQSTVDIFDLLGGFRFVVLGVVVVFLHWGLSHLLMWGLKLCHFWTVETRTYNSTHTKALH